MTSWLDRHFTVGCVLAAIAQFVVAGMHLLDAYERGTAAPPEVAFWGILGLVWMALAITHRSRTRPGAEVSSADSR